MLAPLASAALSGGTAALILTGHPVLAGVGAAASAVVLIGVRGSGVRFEFGWQLASVILDASILLPLAWIVRASSVRMAILALVGFGSAYLVAYESARGRGLGYRGWESLPFRVATTALLVVAVFAIPESRALVEGALWAFTTLVVMGAVNLAWSVRNEERYSAPPVGAPA